MTSSRDIGIFPTILEKDKLPLKKLLRRGLFFVPNFSCDHPIETILGQILWINQCFIALFLFICMSIHDDSLILIYIPDVNSIMGKYRRYFDLIWFFWGIGSVFSGYYIIFQSQVSKDHPLWRISELLERKQFYSSGNYGQAVSIFKSLTYQQAIACPALFLTQCSFYIYGHMNTEYMLNTIILITSFAIAVYFGLNANVNTCSLYCLHLYAYGKYFGHHVGEISGLLKISALKSRHTIKSLIQLNLNLYDEVVRIFNFYQPLIAYSFLITFGANVFILHTILYAKLSVLMKVEFFIYGLTNWVCGQSLTFLASWFAKRKVRNWICRGF